MQSRKYAHQLLEALYMKYEDRLQKLQQGAQSVEGQVDNLQQLIAIYNKIIVSFNLISKKDIPYRSEAIADFLQGTILDEMQSFFSEVDMAQQLHFQK